MLVDGGPDPERLLLQLDARIPPWDRRIDIIVLSHPHEDHVAGLVRGPRAVSASGASSSRAVRTRARLGGVGRGPRGAARGPAARSPAERRLRLGDVRLDVLWPPPGGVQREPASTGTAGSTTPRSCSWARPRGDAASCSPATPRTTSTLPCSRPGSRRSTSSRSPTMAARRRRPTRSSTPHGPRSRSRRPARATATGIPRPGRWHGCGSTARAHSGPTRTAAWRSARRPGGSA